MPRAAKPSTGRSLWERQRDIIRAARATAGKPVTEQVQGVTSKVDELSAAAPALVHPAPRFTFPPLAVPVPAPPPPAPGTYRIDQLRIGQCRFACTPHGIREHRFCGAATEAGPGNLHGSWCAEHLPVVQSSGGAGWKSKAEVAAKGEAA